MSTKPEYAAVLDGWEPGEFTAAGMTFPTYRRGTGPGIVVIHEVPNITPLVTKFANEVVDRGFTVVMPSLFGTPGKPPSNATAISAIARGCVVRDFTALALNRTAPVIAWLRALARNLHQDVGGPGVGAVGMCFTGGFALGMMVDDIMLAPVLSQPSSPLPLGKARAADINLSPDDVAAVVERAAQGCQVLGLRYVDDKAVGDRFSTLRDLLGDAFIAVELPSTGPRDHSVLTEQRDDASVERVLDFFAEKLLV
ncbi:MAG: dienelactone hydrolase [Acidimicrobiales bacterium]|nr:MAG: dienelactone hydrolase [Acidimicrobiales bacterium]